MPSPLLHINRKYHIPLENILSVTQKRWGKVWVAYTDPKTSQKRIAIAKTEINNIILVINSYRIMRGQKQLTPIYEK